MSFNKLKFSIIILTVLHLVGVMGFILLGGQIRDLLLFLTPFNLLISLGFLLAFESNDLKKSLVIYFCIFCICFSMEAIGVSTGWPFGHYAYGKTLGFMLFNVPVVIGFNWLMLVITSTSIVSKFSENKFFISVGSSFLMTILDYIMEPVAMRLDFWNWADGVIPIQNYLSWFLLGSMACFIRVYFTKSLQNQLGAWIFGCQVIFFLALRYFAT